jgi:hypothetical protein
MAKFRELDTATRADEAAAIAREESA